MSIHVYAVFDTKTSADLAALHIRHELPDAHIKTWNNDGGDDDKSDGADPSFWLTTGTNTTGTSTYYAPYPAVMGNVWGDGDSRGDDDGYQNGRERSTQATLSAQVRTPAEADLAARLMRELGGTGLHRA